MNNYKLSLDDIILNETEIAQGRRKQYERMAECSDIFREKNKVSIEQCKHDAEYHEQLAEWLEELKTYRECNVCEYNKAIDDFEQKLLEKAPRNYVGDLELGGSVSFLSANAVTKIAEQLKAGGENERM